MERAKPEDWYRVRRLSDGVTFIDEPFIQEFYRCNVWHVRGRERDMLVDSGMGVVSLREWVPLVTERALTAVASHTHFDHIGCFDDTALSAVRARVSCPVVGLGQAAYFLCALRGWRFSVVTTLPVSVPILEENIEAHGLSGFLGRVRASAIPVLDLETAPEVASARILEETQNASREDKVDAVVLGCAGMVAVTSYLRAQQPTPIVDPIEAAVSGMCWLERQVG